jgi:hypothetical protein
MVCFEAPQMGSSQPNGHSKTSMSHFAEEVTVQAPFRSIEHQEWLFIITPDESCFYFPFYCALRADLASA